MLWQLDIFIKTGSKNIYKRNIDRKELLMITYRFGITAFIVVAILLLTLHAYTYPTLQTNNKIKNDKDKPLIVTSDMKPPILVKKVAPRYPKKAKANRIEGTVIIQAVIDKKGKVEDVTVLRGVDPSLDKSAVRAVKKWRYEPAMVDGKPVRVYFTITVVFILNR